MANVHIRKSFQDAQREQKIERKKRQYRRDLAKKLGNPGVMTEPIRMTDPATGELIYSNVDHFSGPRITTNFKTIFYECPFCHHGFRWKKDGEGIDCLHCGKVIEEDQLLDWWDRRKK